MGTLMDQTPNEARHLIDRLRTGDRPALGELFDRYRDRLRRMVELRMDPRLRARVDASDVLQEAYIELAGDLDAYRADPSCPPCSGCGCTSAAG
jgi:RNA polymerase sigma-70 factor, ECF subfamily